MHRCIDRLYLNSTKTLFFVAIEGLLQDIRSDLRDLLVCLAVVRHLRKHLLLVWLRAAFVVSLTGNRMGSTVLIAHQFCTRFVCM